ncbi:MAG: RecB family exonuclease [Frankiales bacterium]|nr:RecB family exonuclease [Frankiales bacterium]
MEQLGLEGMPTRLFSCTPSRLTSWLDCPRRYRMTYLDRPPPQRGPAWAHNTVGAVAHLALARWWDLPVDKRTGAGARGLLEQAWQTDGFADDGQAFRWKGFAGDMVERYAEGLDPHHEPRGIERTVAFKTDALAVSGRIDRVDDRGDELVVVDYKTGRSALTQDDARGSLALALYALASARTFRKPCTKVELHHLPTGKVLAWEHDEQTLDRHVNRAERIASEAASAQQALVEGGDAQALFPPRPGSLCGWCDFARHCPEGLAASGGPKKPWAGLAEERSEPEQDEAALEPFDLDGEGRLPAFEQQPLHPTSTGVHVDPVVPVTESP